MALIVDSQIRALVESIIPAAGESAAQKAARAQVVEETIEYQTKIFEYFITYMEIQRVRVDTGSLLPITPSVFPGDGGATLHASTNLPNINNSNLIQNNDGTGLVK